MERTIIIPQGTKFYNGNYVFETKQSVEMKYLSWNGSNAGIYMTDSVFEETRRHFPELEKGDVRRIAEKRVFDMSLKYKSLKGIDEIAGRDRKNFETLDEIFSQVEREAPSERVKKKNKSNFLYRLGNKLRS